MEYFKPHLTDLVNTKYETITKINNKYYIQETLVDNNRAIHGDVVYFDNAKVINIKKRNQAFITGILQLNNNTKYGYTKKNVPYYKFVPTSNKFPSFIVPCKKHLKKQPYYVVIKFNKWETNNKHPIGQIEYYLGYVGCKNVETNMLLYKNNIFPTKNKIKYKNNNIENNIEFYTYSIDPDNCKDIDDALHIEKISNSKYIVGIHIANVGEHVNIINFNMFSTIYLDDSQLNMLNDNETYNIYSLGEKTPKKSITLILEYENFKLSNYYFKKTIISNSPLSYNEADNLKNKENHNISILYNFTKNLLKIDEISMTKLVEYYMILYNNLGATILYNYDKNTILRTHSCNGHIDNSNELSKYLSILNKNAAKYETNPQNTTHGDLNIQYYTHLTSPIRRHVDIINQKNILKFLNNEPIITTNCLNQINIFNKNLRKFYNNYKKLKLLYSINKYIDCDCYIICIKHNKVKIYIPSLEIEHSFIIINSKLIDSNHFNSNENYLEINKIKLNLYDKIRITLTPLVFEEKFNKKFNISILEPTIELF